MNYLMIYIFKLFKLLWGLVRHDLTSLLVVLHMQLSYQLTLSVIISGLDEAVLSRLMLSSIVSPLIWKDNKNEIYKLLISYENPKPDLFLNILSFGNFFSKMFCFRTHFQNKTFDKFTHEVTNRKAVLSKLIL